MAHNNIMLNTKEPNTCTATEKTIKFNFGDELNEIQKSTDGNDAGSIKTDTSAS